MAPRKLVLIGFMGAGKSTAARSAGEALGRDALDADRLIEERAGLSIGRIFADDGRGGVPRGRGAGDARAAGRSGGSRARLGRGRHRLRAGVPGAVRATWSSGSTSPSIPHGAGWPAAAGPSPLTGTAFSACTRSAQPVYASLADVTVPGERLDAMPEILDAIQGLPPGAKLLWAASDSGDYPAYIGPGLLTRHEFWPATVTGRRFLVSDGQVARLYGERIDAPQGRVVIMPGEQSKTVAHADIVWTELARAGMTREDVIVALGGGVVGDLAGFCAATYQRGVRYVQVPTSLVAQVDSAYGGKTGVDLEEAKNYVGAYHQPAAVISDTDVLHTLPPAELAAGYAEVVKTALIAGGRLWDQVRAGADRLRPEVILACARTKLRVVEQDERDSGLRQVLNLGHTVGHAIETVPATPATATARRWGSDCWPR